MTLATLHHVTLQTGHVRESPRSEVRDEVVRELAPLLHRVAGGREEPVPWVEGGYTLTGAAAGDVAIVTVWGPRVEGIPAPVVTVGIAAGQEEAGRLWALLHQPYEAQLGEPVTPADQPPPLPWCAARLEVGAAIHVDVLPWMGDLERCLAWAWVERSGRRPGRITRAPTPGRPAPSAGAPRRRRRN